MNRHLILVAALLTAACGGAPPGAGGGGQVRLSATTLAQGPGPASVCAAFTLQPYALGAGGARTLAGSPVTIHSVASSQTDAILGCVDNPAVSGNDWGFLVTASGFNDCGSPALPIPGLSPSIVTGDYPVDCLAGRDIALPIAVGVSISQANAGGFVDISVTVNSSTVQTGCKQADVHAAGGATLLNFGQSVIDPAGQLAGGALVPHPGLLGLSSSGVPRQWGGNVSAGAPSEDTYYTGQLDITATPAITLLQTFAPDNCGAGQEYAGSHHAQCLTTSQPPSTQALLADVFIAAPGVGFVSASIASPTTITLYSVQSAGAGQPRFMDSTAGSPPPTLGFNGGMSTQTLTIQGRTLSGLYIDRSTANQLLAMAVDATGVPAYATVSVAAGSWSIGAFNPLSGLSAAQSSCLGLFTASEGCLSPTPCPHG